MTEPPALGQIVKFTVFKWDETTSNLAEPPIWGIVNSLTGYAGGFTFQPLIGNEDVMSEPETNFSVNDDFDVWDVVPLDDVPDEVCVALAKRALINEGED